MKNIVFIAPPAAGKGTQSKLLCKKYGVAHISTGALLREVTSSGTEEGQKLLEKMQSGVLIEDQYVISLLRKRLQQEDCANGYILDGFPRNKKQALLYDEMLFEMGSAKPYVFLLMLSYEEASKRITGRLSCPKCGHIFNDKIESLMPKIPSICDICGEALVKRKDDNEETFKMRFVTYEKETKPLIDYYEERNLLYRIDSSREATDVFHTICNMLEEGNL